MQITRKKLLSLVFLSVAICLSISIGMGVTFASASEFSKGEITETAYFANIDKSIMVYDDAISPYRSTTRMRSGEEIITYSEDFAGVFIDEGGLLNIGVVGLRQATYIHLKNILTITL